MDLPILVRPPNTPNRLRLADILVQPMQRLTKYSLLLRAIKKHIPASDETALLNMLAMVSSPLPQSSAQMHIDTLTRTHALSFWGNYSFA